MALKALNFRLIFRVLGLVLIFEGLFLGLNLIACLVYDHSTIAPILKSLLITSVTGILLYYSSHYHSQKEIAKKDGFITVTLSWLAISLFGTLPYLISGGIPRFTDAFFESVSGFTTTGSSILANIEGLPRGILFWRSLTHWIGGMGIIMLMLAVFPFFKIGGMHLFNSEYSTASFERLKPKLIDTAKRLWMVYVLLTLAEIIMLCLGGMELFDSICHSFGTIATGGFSPKNTSLINYSPYIHYVVTVFMMLSGINFTLHYFWLTGVHKKLFQNEEFRYYLLIILVAGGLITLLLMGTNYSFEASFRHSFFQVVSIITSTGFSTDDYLIWPASAAAIIFFLMFVGGCAGSTSGGIKVVRHVISAKRMMQVFKNLAYPQTINKLFYNKNALEPGHVNSVMNFVFVYLLTFFAGFILLVIFGTDFATSAGSVATTLGGIGPGFGLTGPMGNFSMIPEAGKYLLCATMLLGRLELFTIYVLFSPGFWKS